MRRRLKRHTVFVTFLIPNLIILIVSVIIGAVFYSKNVVIVRGQVEKYNYAMLQQTQMALEERIYGIKKMMVYIGTDPSVQKVLSVNSDTDSNDIYYMLRTINVLSNSKQTDSAIQNIYLYIKKSDKVISNVAVYSTDSFYNQQSNYTAWNMNQWLEMLGARYFLECQPAQDVMTSEGKKNLITIFLSVPFSSVDNSLGTIAVSIDSDKLKNIMSEMNLINNGAVYITDKENRTILSIGDTGLINSANDFTISENTVYRNIRGENVGITKISPDKGEWNYISVVPTKYFMKENITIRNTAYVMLCLYLIAGIVLACLFSKRNALPIRSVFNILNGKVSIDRDSINAEDEIEFINFAADKIVTDYKKIQSEMNKQIPILQSDYIMQLIKGNVTEIMDIQDSLSALGISFGFQYFSIIIINIDKYAEDTIKERNLMKFVISNIIGEIGPQKYEIYMINLDLDRLAFLVNLPAMDEQYKNELQTIANSVLNFLKSKFSTLITVSIGGIVNGVDKIYISYQQALRTIECQLLNEIGRVVRYDDRNINDIPYSYSIETEIQLINSVKVGDISKVDEILNEIYNQNFVNNSLSLEMVRCLFFDMMSTAIKIISNCGDDSNIIFGKLNNPYEQIMSCRNISEMQAVLTMIYGEICKYIISNRRGQNKALIKSIIEYIKNHYNSTDLSLVSVADAFSINPNYLSGYFKEQTGYNFINYVNQIKLEEVKRLLQDTNMSLQEISKKVGYSTSGVLIRNFKKYIGSTPSEYREKSVLS
jgi:Response regulator containing CheY-like receiver domain and AraC-type DNA-binding domain